ncbi:MAG: hypothetical protein HKN34_05805 [Gammaproteobacteria bacterium]|nr:hypothetical protein [Gammaproteobacteria bacterium]
MQDDDNIPLLTDLIEERIDITVPELGLDSEHDLIIEPDEEPEFSFNPEDVEPAMSSSAATRIGKHAELERTLRRILDEHLELAWQEIRLAIEVALDDDDENSRN